MIVFGALKKSKMLKCVKAVLTGPKNKDYTIKKDSELLSIRIHIKIITLHFL